MTPQQKLEASIALGVIGAVDKFNKSFKARPEAVESMVAAAYLSGIQGVLTALEGGEKVPAITAAFRKVGEQLHMRKVDGI